MGESEYIEYSLHSTTTTTATDITTVGGPKESSQTQIYIKLIFIAVIFLETILFGIIP